MGGTFSAFKPRNKERWAVGVRRHRREVIDPNYQSPFERKKMNISLIENTSIRRSDINNTVSTSNSTTNGKVLSSLIVDNHQSCSSLVAKTVKGHGLLHHEVNWPVRPLLRFFSM